MAMERLDSFDQFAATVGVGEGMDASDDDAAVSTIAFRTIFDTQ